MKGGFYMLNGSPVVPGVGSHTPRHLRSLHRELVSFLLHPRYGDMRILLNIIIAFTITASAHAVTIHDLTFRLAYDKHVFPGRLLRGELDYPVMMVQAEYYYKEALFTGTVSDTSLEFIEITFDKGKIISYSKNWDGENYYRYNVTGSNLYTWYAVDVVFENGTVIRRGEYFMDAMGTYRCVINEYIDEKSYVVKPYLLSSKKGRKENFITPVPHGLSEIHYENGSVTTQQYVLGTEKGLFEVKDSTGRVLDRAYTNPDSVGMYGEFLHIETERNTITTGQYDRGYNSGVWVTRDLATNAVIEKEWFHPLTGESDSVKSWYPDGKLQWVQYTYDPIDFPRHIDVSTSYYHSGAIQEFTNNSGGDTTWAMFTEDGKPTLVHRYVGSKLQCKSWYPGTEQLRYERYYDGEHSYRDSVYREWDERGQLVTEKFYSHGKFLRSTITHPLYMDPGEYTHVATAIAVEAATEKKAPWDTTFFVPRTVTDSIDNRITLARQETHGASWMNVADNCNESYSPGSNDFGDILEYQLTLIGLDTCKLNQLGFIVTDNHALSAFLDSLGIYAEQPLQLFESGRKRKKKKGYHGFVMTNRFLLNLSYVNRRLDALQPGSHIEYYREGIPKFPDDVLYIPEGTKTLTDTLPFTVVSFAEGIAPHSEGRMTYETPDNGFDARIYHTYIVYGDGEAEYIGDFNRTSVYQRFGIYSVNGD